MTKIISISDDAYNELKKLKRALSFSKIIIELAKEKKKESIMECAGLWENKEAIKIKKELMKERKLKSRRLS